MEDQSKLRAVFNSIDADGGGTIDKHELKSALLDSGRECTDAQVGGGVLGRRIYMVIYADWLSTLTPACPHTSLHILILPPSLPPPRSPLCAHTHTHFNPPPRPTDPIRLCIHTHTLPHPTQTHPTCLVHIPTSHFHPFLPPPPGSAPTAATLACSHLFLRPSCPTLVLLYLTSTSI